MKKDGDAAWMLQRGEIVEQVGEQEQIDVKKDSNNKITRMPITHPSSASYPKEIGWVTLDAT